MTSILATNAVPSISRALESDREGFPIQGQVPKTYQVYNGDGDTSIILEGKDFLVIQSTLPDGALLIRTGGAEGNTNLHGRTVRVITPLGITSDVILDMSPGQFRLEGSAIPSNTYTVVAPEDPLIITLEFFSITECMLSIQDGGGGGGVTTVPFAYSDIATSSIVSETQTHSLLSLSSANTTITSTSGSDRGVVAASKSVTLSGVISDVFVAASENCELDGSKSAIVGCGNSDATGTRLVVVASDDYTATGNDKLSLGNTGGETIRLESDTGAIVTTGNIQGNDIASNGNIGCLGSIAATVNVSGATLSGALTPNNITPGTNGQLLQTVGGTTTWVNKSVVIPTGGFAGVAPNTTILSNGFTIRFSNVTTVSRNTGGAYNIITGQYTVPVGVTAVNVQCSISFRWNGAGNPAVRVGCSVRHEGTSVMGSFLQYPAGFNAPLTIPGMYGVIPVTAGDVIVIRWNSDANDPAMRIQQGFRSSLFITPVEFS